jgi:DNA-directed RNA polymerase specialized sigma24 family protein
VPSPEVDDILRYSNHNALVSALSDVVERLANDEDRPHDVDNVPHDLTPRRPAPQINRLAPEQRASIIASYTSGIGPRALAEQFDVTERAIKYLVKKHGIRRDLPGGANRQRP